MMIKEGLQRCSLLLVGLIFMSCTITTHRKYLSEMDKNNDLEAFRPKVDFPVVSGDSQFVPRRSRQTILNRTPAAKESPRLQAQQYLQSDLRYRESRLGERERAQYQHYRHLLATQEEKLYFLELPNIKEREHYIRSKSTRHRSPLTVKQHNLAAHHSDIILGMSKDHVLSSWGRPHRVDVAGDPRLENERWAYFVDGKTRYVYFERGLVEGWRED